MEWPFQRLKTIHSEEEWRVYGLSASDEMFTNEFFICKTRMMWCPIWTQGFRMQRKLVSTKKTAVVQETV